MANVSMKATANSRRLSKKILGGGQLVKCGIVMLCLRIGMGKGLRYCSLGISLAAFTSNPLPMV